MHDMMKDYDPDNIELSERIKIMENQIWLLTRFHSDLNWHIYRSKFLQNSYVGNANILISHLMKSGYKDIVDKAKEDMYINYKVTTPNKRFVLLARVIVLELKRLGLWDKVREEIGSEVYVDEVTFAEFVKDYPQLTNANTPPSAFIGQKFPDWNLLKSFILLKGNLAIQLQLLKDNPEKKQEIEIKIEELRKKINEESLKFRN